MALFIPFTQLLAKGMSCDDSTPKIQDSRYDGVQCGISIWPAMRDSNTQLLLLMVLADQ